MKNNIIAEAVCKTVGGCFMESNNIVWKFKGGEWIGKRSVWTFDFRACWLEETTQENIKSWWCGKDSDYSEIFKREDQSHERPD